MRYINCSVCNNNGFTSNPCRCDDIFSNWSASNLHSPFCDNKACDLNKYKAKENESCIRINKGHDVKIVQRYKFKNNIGSVMLCETCKNAVDLIMR